MLNKQQQLLNKKNAWFWTEEINSEIYDKNINWPKISIVTPSYNQGQFIEETIRSILLQNYPNLEYIIIDGGSNDNTVEIIRKYEKDITYWVSESDEGQSHAINKGLKKCNGEIFNWINSDDYLEKDALYHIGKAFAENKNTDVVCGYINIFENKNKKIKKHYRMYIGKDAEDTFFNYLINQPGTFWNLKTIIKIGGINQTLNFIFDLEVWWRYLAIYGQEKVMKIPNLICNFRFHYASKQGHLSKKFDNERYSLYRSLCKTCNVPEYILKLMPLPDISLKFSYNYGLSKFISCQSVLLHFSKRYYMKLNAKNMYNETKNTIKLLIKNNMFILNCQNIKLIFKYFIIPKKILLMFKKYKTK